MGEVTYQGNPKGESTKNFLMLSFLSILNVDKQKWTNNVSTENISTKQDTQ